MVCKIDETKDLDSLGKEDWKRKSREDKKIIYLQQALKSKVTLKNDE